MELIFSAATPLIGAPSAEVQSASSELLLVLLPSQTTPVSTVTSPGPS